jgi:hypothetical protein
MSLPLPGWGMGSSNATSLTLRVGSRPNNRHESQSAKMHLGLQALSILLDALSDKSVLAADRALSGDLVPNALIKCDQTGVGGIFEAYLRN